MNQKNEHAIFFAALVAMGVLFVGGIVYFKTQPQSDSLLADIAATTAPAVETIPTSTIVDTSSGTDTSGGATSTASSSPSSSTSSTPSAVATTPPPPPSPLKLPYSLTAATANATYWPKTWGTTSFANNGAGESLALIPEPTTRGANSFLDAPSSWTNYGVSTNVSSLMGGWFDIVARVADNEHDFVYCEFGPNGTEIIERVNDVDNQLAAVTASTTDNASGATENFGMQVYGNDIACTMAGQEVVGARVTNGDESQRGGIGFVIFNAPPEQKQVALNNISVTALSQDNITVPFPAPVQPTPTPVVATPVPTPTPTPTPTPISSTPTPASTAPATTTKTLPYSADTYYTGDGWGQYWGTFSEAADGLTIGSNASIPSGGALLDGTAQLDNYTFSATFDWLEGEEVGLFARHTDNDNYVECKIDRIDSADVRMSLVQDVHGRYFTLNQTVLPDYIDVFGKTFTASVEVQDTAATCNFDGHVLSLAGTGLTINPPYSGEVGITTWDPGKNNSRIVVTSDSINENY